MSVTAAVREAVASVDDPEFPGVSIADLGLVEAVTVDEAGQARVGLIPTFSGCPALPLIADQVAAAVAAVPGVSGVAVEFLPAPVWTSERITAAGRAQLADRYTVGVAVGTAPVSCPQCGSPTELQSLFGPTRCRQVHRCPGCGEVVEVVR